MCSDLVDNKNVKGVSLAIMLLMIGWLLSGVRTATADQTSLGLDPLINYTIQQLSSARYVDAHENASEDYRLVTRTAQNNNTQRWKLTPQGNDIYTIQQVSNNRYIDAHENASEDYRLVTRTAQNNNTQRWKLTPLGNDIYTIQQVSNNRYIDAHENAGEDYRLVTRTAQNNETQRWRIKAVDTFTIQQVSNNRYVDAHEVSGQDYRLVTRPAQNNWTQKWKFTPLGNDIYTIQQLSNNRYVDAHENSDQDYRLVTRTAQNNNTQKWKLTSLGHNKYTIQQVSNNRYVDAHEHAGEDYRLVTRTAQNNNTQRWILTADTFLSNLQELTVSRHNNTNLTSERADTILADASEVLQSNDGTGDTACEATLVRSGNIRVFNEGDGSLDTSAQLNAVFNLPGNVKVVDDVNYCAGQFNTSYIGCGQMPGTSFITERFTLNQEGILWLHEYGHNKGLNHRNTSTNNVMYWSIGTNRLRVNSDECAAFKRQQGGLTAATGAPGHKNDKEKLPAPKSVKEFVSQIYPDGLPLDQAASYDKSHVKVLLNMLGDLEQVRYHENIALTLGMIGDEQAVEPLIAYILTGSKGTVTKMPRPAYKGRVGAIMALGYLLNFTNSDKALSFLKESTFPNVWQKRNISGLTPDTKRKHDLSKYAIMSLGLSGNPRAVIHLKSLRDKTQQFTKEDTTFLKDAEHILHQSFQLNEEISREGLRNYYKKDAK